MHKANSKLSPINTVEELEYRLSEPTEEDVATMSALKGDILILGAAGKMGPSLAKLAGRSILRAGIKKRVIAVARFSDSSVCSELETAGIETITCDLLKPGSLASLPQVENVVFMAARKFGTSGSEHLTWGMNTFLPGLVAERYRSSQIVAFSTGNVYGLQPVAQGGAVESTPVA
ncbi:MAG: epimerase, partial [Acidobacteria bacterium]